MGFNEAPANKAGEASINNEDILDTNNGSFNEAPANKAGEAPTSHVKAAFDVEKFQ